MAHEDEAGQGLHGSASMWKFAGEALGTTRKLRVPMMRRSLLGAANDSSAA
jgi:hypothetical protein